MEKNKKKLLEEITQKINICKSYQISCSDSSLKNRIEKMDNQNDSFSEKQYFVNVTFKDGRTEEITSGPKLERHKSEATCIFSENDTKNTFELGALIIIKGVLNSKESYSISMKEYKNLYDLCKTIYDYAHNDSALIRSFNGLDTSGTYGCITTHIEEARILNRNTIVYSIGRFNLDSILSNFAKTIKGNFKIKDDVEIPQFKGCDLDSINLNGITEMEKIIIDHFCKNDLSTALCKVLMTSEKENDKNTNLSNKHKLIDMTSYVSINIFGILEKNDKTLLSDQIESCNSIYSIDDSSNEKFLKYLSNVEKDDSNPLILEKLKAYINAFNDNKLLKYGWQNDKEYAVKEIDKSNIFFKDRSIQETVKETYKNLLTGMLIDPPMLSFKSYDSNVETGKSLISLDVPLKSYDKNGNPIKTNTPYFENDKTYEYKNVSIIIKLNNVIRKDYRNYIILSDAKYSYMESEFYDNTNKDIKYVNDLTGNETSRVPAKSYCNLNTNRYFSSTDLLKRMCIMTPKATIMPIKITVPIKFKTVGIFATKDNAVTAFNSAKEQYKDSTIRIVIDTINYDPWLRLIAILQNLLLKFSLAKTDADGNLINILDNTSDSK